MSDALAVEIANVEAAIGQGATLDPVERTLAEVEGVIGAYRSPEQIAAEEAAIVKADEARAAEYRQPPTVTADQLGKALKGDHRTLVVAHSLGEHGLGYAARAMSSIPRDVLEVADAAGALATGRTWALLRDIGEGLAGQPKRLDPAPQHELTADDVRDHLGDRLDGLPADAADALAILLNELPPPVLEALEGREDDDLIELGVHLGRKLWAFVPPRPPRKDQAMQTTATTRKSADDLLADARSLQASEAYGDSSHPRHRQVRETVTRIYQKLYPQPKEAGQ